MTFYQQGREAYYDGTQMPEGLSPEAQADWQRGWSTADSYEEWKLDQAMEGRRRR